MNFFTPEAIILTGKSQIARSGSKKQKGPAHNKQGLKRYL
jgi:hypothetical protein